MTDPKKPIETIPDALQEPMDQPLKVANETIENEPFGRIDDACIERMMKALITNRDLD